MDEPVTVAVVGPFSGPRAAWGELLTRAAGRAEHPAVRWEFLDDEGTVAGARTRAAEIVRQARCVAVLGHFNSLGARAALPLYRAADLPVLLPLATATGLLAGSGGCAVRWCPDDTGQVRAIGRALRERGHRTVSVRHDGTDYGRRLAARFAGPGDVLAVPGDIFAGPGEVFAGPGEVEVRFGGLQEPVVLCGAHHTVAALVHRVRGYGYRGLLVVTDDCQVPEFAALAGKAAEPALVARLAGGPQRPVDEAFAALTAALAADRTARGAALRAAVRAACGRTLTPDGDPVDGASGAGWEVVPLAAPAADTASGAATAPGVPAAGSGPDRVLGVPVRPASLAGAGDRPLDVAVVGAGVVGAEVAARLARAGLRVAVVDRGGRGAATPFSGALVRAFEPGPGLRALSLRSYALTWGRTDGYARAHGFHRTGSLVLLGPEHLADAEAGVRELGEAGVAAELLPVGELRRRWPALATDGLAGAVWEPGGGYASPQSTVDVQLRAARSAGARLLPGQAVSAVTAGPDGSARLHTDGGVLHATVAVLAAGCGTPVLLAGRLPGGVRTKRIRYAFYDRTGHRVPAFVDLVGGAWGRPDGDDRFLAGYPMDEWDVPVEGGDTLARAFGEHIRRACVARLPWLDSADLLGGRFGTDLYPTGRPLWCPVPGAPRTLVAAGWSGGGFKTAPAVAEQTAAWALALVRGESVTVGKG